MSRAAGFTLLEVLIAVALFALVGLAGHRLLDSALQVERRATLHQEQWRQLARAIALIEADVEQAVLRPVRTDEGTLAPAMWLDPDSAALAWTRGGWDNPLQQPRGNLQRVRWQLQQGQLVRHFWQHPDGAGDGNARRQQVLEHVDGLQWRFLDARNRWHDHWPAAGSEGLPRALELQLSVPGHGAITRLLRLPDGAAAQGPA